LPYTLERQLYGPSSGETALNSGMSHKLHEKKTPKLNRYFEKLKPYYKLKENSLDTDNTLIFESRFECGNLKKAVKV
jgi:hypothetical protein